ncbi:MAG: threonylcarbamoyl-AMP synthase [Saprospiraceae bacterium]|nr:threonylcarbamoyl-AMP synthase [Saprospiraceae bacterium]
MAEIGTDIAKSAKILREGGIVAIPTETVYGLAGNALDVDAIDQIFSIKNRPSHNPLIIHIGHRQQLLQYVKDIPAQAQILGQHFWPGPLTMILPRKPIIPDVVTSGLTTVAVRMPNHPLTLGLLQSIDFPLAAPSANPFGYISPTAAEHVAAQLGDRIPYILDGGPCTLGLESTIVSFQKDKPALLRYGAITPSEIEEVLGTAIDISTETSPSPLGPGMLPYHYAPGTSIRVVTDLKKSLLNCNEDRTGIIAFSRTHEEIPLTHQIVLSASADLDEAGKRLYHALRLMDKLDLDLILVERLPDQGLGLTMNDRLEKAAAKD